MRNRNFVMVVVGQIISLFGNTVLRFVLPLYLLSETGSAALFGIVSACAFIPMIVLAPVGGIFADRVNKRNIMVILDFSTAILVLFILCLLGKLNVVALIFTALFILYGIQGAYQPAVQASIPALLSNEHIMQGNAVINLVSSFSGLIGPVIGGTLFGFFGITPILYVSLCCFLLSAAMELFIRIPFEKKEARGTIFSIGLADLKESFHYMNHDQPVIMQFSLAAAAINMILSALMIIGLPVIVTQLLAILVSCFFMMFLATLFSIQIMSYLQMIVPEHLIGKVISCAMCIGMCATPVGQAIYGGLFEALKEKVYGLFFTVTVIVVLLAFAMKKPFARMAELFAERKNIK